MTVSTLFSEMGEGFLHDNNLCGQTLLRLTSRGSAIIAELLRLGDNIPAIFRGAQHVQDPDELKYTKVLFDFQYLKTPEVLEQRVNASLDLLEADEEFQENHMEILERFYTLFDSIYKYIEDYKRFLKDLADGFFIQHTTEGILLDTEGRQLMCEALYLAGVMLILLDRRIPGPVRERMIVAYYRCRGEASLTSMDEVCRLFRSTGFLPRSMLSGEQERGGRELDGSRRPVHYPDDFLARLEVPQSVVRLVVDVLRQDDVFLMGRSFPAPHHRSIRLANQASMLYVVLFFAPDVLDSESSTMREIVGKFFADNWILPVYMGVCVDLGEAWGGGCYRAARAALDSTLQMAHITRLNANNTAQLSEAGEELEALLVEGVLSEQYLLDNFSSVLASLQKSNAALRWRLLHRTCRAKKVQEVVMAGAAGPAGAAGVMTLLLNTAEMERRSKELLDALLASKESRWRSCRGAVAARMRELADYFGGQQALSRVERDDSLISWFSTLADQVSGIEYGDATLAGRQVQQLINALEEVEQFEQIYSSVQIKAFLDDSRKLLLQMIRIVNVSDSVLDVLATVSDLSYAWELIECYKPHLHARVEKAPGTVRLLRALFLKLASILDIPLVRINQCDSPDTISVAEYYSGELVQFVRRVLAVVPVSVFRILTQIVEIQTARLRPLPVRLEAVALKEYAQLDERYELARLTHQVSQFTEGILAMEKTLLGVLQVDPKRILEDAIRQELVQQVSTALHRTLNFNTYSPGEVEQVLTRVSEQMSGFRRAIEYVQDYIGLAGLRMFQEELYRCVNFNVEQEVNRFLKKKVQESSSKYQSRAIPIPRFPPTAEDKQSCSFMGRVVQCLLRLTDFRFSIYAPERSGWFTPGGQEVCGLGTLSILQRSVGVLGLTGVDRLLAFRTVHTLNLALRLYRKNVTAYLPDLRTLEEQLEPLSRLPVGAQRLYAAALKRCEPVMAPLLELVQTVGQCSLLRKQISNELTFSCQLDANLLSSSLAALNASVLTDVRRHYRKPDAHPLPADDNPVLGELSTYMSAAGMTDPLAKIYLTTDPLECLPLFLMLFSVAYSSKLTHSAHFATLVRRKEKYPLDGTPLVVGLVTLLHQFHPSYRRQYLALLGQFVRASVGAAFATDASSAASSTAAPAELPLEALNVLLLMDQFCRFARIPRSVLDSFVPPYVLDTLELPAPPGTTS